MSGRSRRSGDPGEPDHARRQRVADRFHRGGVGRRRGARRHRCGRRRYGACGRRSACRGDAVDHVVAVVRLRRPRRPHRPRRRGHPDPHLVARRRRPSSPGRGPVPCRLPRPRRAGDRVQGIARSSVVLIGRLAPARPRVPGGRGAVHWAVDSLHPRMSAISAVAVLHVEQGHGPLLPGQLATARQTSVTSEPGRAADVEPAQRSRCFDRLQDSARSGPPTDPHRAAVAGDAVPVLVSPLNAS